MFYRESATIVGNQDFIEEDIEAIDDYLHENPGKPVRIGRIADFTDLGEDDVEYILQSYLVLKVVSQTTMPVCPIDDQLMEDPADDGSYACDLCEGTFNPDKLDFETVFIPRPTIFECGDILPIAHGGVPDVEGLEKIIGCSSQNRIADVVFVHGMNGDAMTTWHPKGEPEKYWPKWLGEDLPGVGVWALGYEANSNAWRGDSMPLTDRATNVVATLSTVGIGEHPIIFITHSLGGLVAKAVVRKAHDSGNAKWSAIANNTCGVVFFATPHAGSDLANYAKYVSLLYRGTVTIDDLEAHNPHLRDLNQWYRDNSDKLGIESQIFFEMKESRVLGKKMRVVDQTSADPGISGAQVIPIDANHEEICKADSKTALVYQMAKSFVQDCISEDA